MRSCGTDGESSNSPWLCHVCGASSSRGESIACDVCYRTVCPAHVRRTPMLSEETGLYHFVSVCFTCAAAEVLR